jgi:hypothetical protein
MQHYLAARPEIVTCTLYEMPALRAIGERLPYNVKRASISRARSASCGSHNTS